MCLLWENIAFQGERERFKKEIDIGEIYIIPGMPPGIPPMPPAPPIAAISSGDGPADFADAITSSILRIMTAASAADAIACVFTREHTRRYLTRYSLSSV